MSRKQQINYLSSKYVRCKEVGYFNFDIMKINVKELWEQKENYENNCKKKTKFTATLRNVLVNFRY